MKKKIRKDKSKRKQYLIDRKFQLKHTFTVLGLLLVIVAVMVCIIGAFVMYNNHKLGKINLNSNDMTGKLENIHMLQGNLMETIMTWVQAPSGRPEKTAIKAVWEKHAQNQETIEKNITIIKGNISTINTLIKYNRILLYSIITIIIVQAFVFYFVMIRKTHKISGPIYVMSQYMKEIIDGRLPEVRSIRKDDYLQEFYSLFREMCRTLKQRL